MATIEYVRAELYDAVGALGGERFDCVYTGVGALCWLPSIARWAQIVAGLLRPGGRLFIREGHPVLWSMDDPRDDDLLVIRYPYFEVPGGTQVNSASSAAWSKWIVRFRTEMARSCNPAVRGEACSDAAA